MAHILIIDDDELICTSLKRYLADLGHGVSCAKSLTLGKEQAREGVDVIYLDLNLPDGDGRAAIDELAAMPAGPEIIVLTGLRDNFGAQETLTSGAWDYIQKPATPTALRRSLESALKYRAGKQAIHEPSRPFDAGGILGDSPAMGRVKQLMAKAADSDASVLVLGETGVGKELTAKAIHNNSSRREMAFVVVDCSNLTESLLESVLYGHVKGAFTGAHSNHHGLVAEADGGTLFLDEVGELPPSLQKSFLRVLQEQRFRPVGSSREKGSNFRLIAATNRDLDAMTEAGTFRSDLLFRLRTLEIRLPSLGQRDGDIVQLAEYFTRKACDRYGFPVKRLAGQVVKILTSYAWPGNVRELGHVMEAAAIAAGKEPTLYPKHLPGHIRISYLDRKKPQKITNQHIRQPANAPIQSYAAYKHMRDQAYFRQLMDICNYDMIRASELSGLSVPSIYRHLSAVGIPTKSRQ